MSVRARLVTTPEPGAVVLADLNEGRKSAYLQAGDFSFGEPAWSGSRTGVVEGTREITLPVGVRGATRQQVEARLSQIAQALMRPGRTTWLEFQLDSDASPTWYRLHQGGRGSVSLDRVFTDDVDLSTHQWTITVVADAWGVSQRVQLPPVNLSLANPSALLDGVEGDVPAPVDITITPSVSLALWQPAISVASVRPESPYQGAKYWPHTFMTPGTGCAVTTARGGGIIVNTPSTDFGWNGIARGEIPEDIPAGTYTVNILVERDSGTGGGWFKAGSITDGSWPLLTDRWVPWNPHSGSGRDVSWLRCGNITLPAGLDPRVMDDDAYVRPTLTVNFRPDGSNSKPVLKAMILTPVDLRDSGGPASTLLPQWLLVGPDASSPMKVAGDARLVGSVSSTGAWRNVPTPVITGGFPVVYPNARNYLSILMRVNPRMMLSSAPSMLAATATATVSYRPRWMHQAATS